MCFLFVHGFDPAFDGGVKCYWNQLYYIYCILFTSFSFSLTISVSSIIIVYLRLYLTSLNVRFNAVIIIKGFSESQFLEGIIESHCVCHPLHKYNVFVGSRGALLLACYSLKTIFCQATIFVNVFHSLMFQTPHLSPESSGGKQALLILPRKQPAGSFY